MVLSGLKSMMMNCPDHKYNLYTHYCYNENTPICQKCVDTDPAVENLDHSAAQETKSIRSSSVGGTARNALEQIELT
eukprot:CAMPEP_0170502660 /NCGR_PEP_ID=MMETSP0208-20121228/42210_1 /TAXON_ID=197538 /ORGANISM="Strombidium inclinatum, Strain S3" /LENGTH=76 /DNA_ID=CAMNT_0010781869 /DNA_START=493 /DNA_END=723 /DNA_ORIENTATION=-